MHHDVDDVTNPLDRLLEVQGHDTRLDQLRHQLATLPAREERDAAAGRLAALDADLEAVRTRRAELGREQKRLEDEIALVADRRSHEEATLYGGTVTNARALQDLQEEIDALGRRITVLEDQDLEIMEQLEPVDARLAELDTARATTVTELEVAERALTAAEAELGVLVDAEADARASAVVGIPDDLLAEYEKLRSGRGGIGVARLVGSQCGGCHLALSAVELARLRKLGPGEVTHCEECGRLLVP